MQDQINIFKISDLVGQKNDTQSKTLFTRKYNKIKNSQAVVEISSFKVANKSGNGGNVTVLKKKKDKSHNTSDIMWYHDEKMEYFRHLQESLPKKIKLFNQKKLSHNEQKKLQQEIEDIKNLKEENDYHEKTRDLISKYKDSETRNFESNDDSKGVMKYAQKYDNIEKKKLAEEYCRLLNNGMMINSNELVFQNNFCTECGSETKYIESFVTCIECGLVSSNSTHEFQISYKDLCDTMIKTNFAYKRTNRFKEILATLQAKENTGIPAFVLNAVKIEINKEYKKDLQTIDIKKMKEYLKKLSLTAYYDHAPNILNSINGIRAINIPEFIEDKFLQMFDLIQEPFEVVKTKVAPNRLSFLSYNYCFFKFCELLELEDLKKHFSLLKSVDKLRLQDKIWEGICDILDWEYIPSI